MAIREPAAADTLLGSPHYCRDSFLTGLARCGYHVDQAPKLDPDPDDVLLIWNRGERSERHVQRYFSATARVIVAENGYIGQDQQGEQLFALALDNHNGAGWWPRPQHDRWSSMAVDLVPWHESGAEIVVLPQRGIGDPAIAMPPKWPEDVSRRLRDRTDRPVRIRPHPGKARTDPRSDLRNAWAAVTWGSGAAIKALAGGVPVFHEMPNWIGAPAAVFGIDQIEAPFMGDRLPMFRRLAWAQWRLSEIRSGEAFRWLLG